MWIHFKAPNSLIFWANWAISQREEPQISASSSSGVGNNVPSALPQKSDEVSAEWFHLAAWSPDLEQSSGPSLEG